MTTKTAGPARRKRRLIIGHKLASIVAVIVMVGLADAVGMQITQTYDNLVALATDDNKRITRLLASQMSGSVKWKIVSKIEPACGDLANDPSSTVAGLIVLDPMGETLAEY